MKKGPVFRLPKFLNQLISRGVLQYAPTKVTNYLGAVLVGQQLKEIYLYREMLKNLVAKELRARYKGSVLGFFWTFFNPLLMLIVYSVVFSFVDESANRKLRHVFICGPASLELFCNLCPARSGKFGAKRLL